MNHIFIFVNFSMQTLIFINHHIHNKADITLSEHLVLLFVYHCIFYMFVFQKLSWIVNNISLFLGKISYSLYLCHQYVSLYFIIPFGTIVLGLSLYKTIILIALPIVIGLAFLFNKFVEVPFQNKLRSMINLKN
jgi:peptidoglycan/LPS O-acetylase OafA/YrhL